MKVFAKVFVLVSIILGFISCTQYRFIPIFPGGEEINDVPSPDYSWLNEADGSENNPYILRTVDDILGFAFLVTSGNAFDDQYVELVANTVYDFADVNDFDGIGYGIRMAADSNEIVDPFKPFSGSFDGKNAIIRNMSMSVEEPSGGDNTVTGFFNATFFATVKNINFENCSVVSTANHTGTAIGFSLNSDVSGITVRNSNIKSRQGAGGIFGVIFSKNITGYEGWNEYVITDNHAYNVNCTASTMNAGAITGQLLHGASNTHQVFSNNTAELDEKYNISAEGASGGLIGYGSFANGQTHDFSGNCISIASVGQIIAESADSSEATRGYLIGNWPCENLNESTWTGNEAIVGGVSYIVIPNEKGGMENPGSGEVSNNINYVNTD